jgi:D-aminopeptidase
MSERTFKESFKVAGDQLVDAVRKILHEGNVRRVVIKQDGRSVAEFPLTAGVIGAVFAPVLAAVGALAAVLTECTVEVERIVHEAPDVRKTAS